MEIVTYDSVNFKENQQVFLNKNLGSFTSLITKKPFIYLNSNDNINFNNIIINNILNNNNIIHNSLFTHNAVSGTKQKLKSISSLRALLYDVLPTRKSFKGQVFSLEEQNLLLDKRVNKIEFCSLHGYSDFHLLKEKECYKIFKMRLGCNSRLCPNCVEVKKKAYRYKLRKVVEKYKNPRFMTIGFKNPINLTKEFLSNCSKEFNTFKRYLKRGYSPIKLKNLMSDYESDSNFSIPQKMKSFNLGLINNKLNDKNFKFSYSLDNYIAVLEIELHYKGDPIFNSLTKKQIGVYSEDNWNVHYHILYDGSFIPHFVAMDCLKRATKNKSQFVNILSIKTHSSDGRNKIKNKFKALNYITKYITKMIFSSDDYSKQLEYYKATQRIRFVKVYGFKPIKTESNYEMLSTYLKENHFDEFTDFDGSYDYYSISDFILSLDVKMSRYGANHWDLELTDEDNIFLYAHNQIKNLMNDNLLKTYGVC